jgi:hypothetical protein
VDTILFAVPFFFHRNIVQRQRETGEERKLNLMFCVLPRKIDNFPKKFLSFF